METLLMGLLISMLALPYWKGWGRYSPGRTGLVLLMGLTLPLTGHVTAESTQPDTFDERDTRVLRRWRVRKTASRLRRCIMWSRVDPIYLQERLLHRRN